MAEDRNILTDLESIISLCSVSDKITSPEGLKEADLSKFAGLKEWHECIYKLGKNEEALATSDKEKGAAHIDKALVVYEFIFKHNPDHIQTLQALGTIYLAREDYEKLREVHKKLKEKDSLKGTVLDGFDNLLEGKKEVIAQCNTMFNTLRNVQPSPPKEISESVDLITKANCCLRILLRINKEYGNVYDSQLTEFAASIIADASCSVEHLISRGVEESSQMVTLDSVPRSVVKQYSQKFKLINLMFDGAQEYIHLRNLLEETAHLPKKTSAILKPITFSMEFLKYQKNVGYDPVTQHVTKP